MRTLRDSDAVRIFTSSTASGPPSPHRGDRWCGLDLIHHYVVPLPLIGEGLNALEIGARLRLSGAAIAYCLRPDFADR